MFSNRTQITGAQNYLIEALKTFNSQNLSKLEKISIYCIKMKQKHKNPNPKKISKLNQIT
jgi:hypothetical protein